MLHLLHTVDFHAGPGHYSRVICLLYFCSLGFKLLYGTFVSLFHIQWRNLLHCCFSSFALVVSLVSFICSLRSFCCLTRFQSQGHIDGHCVLFGQIPLCQQLHLSGISQGGSFDLLQQQCHPAAINQMVMNGLHCLLGDAMRSERG